MPARSGRRLIERVGLTEAPDTTDIRQALFKRREAAIRAAIFPVISAPRIILRLSRRADHAHSGEDSQKAKQCFHGFSFRQRFEPDLCSTIVARTAHNDLRTQICRAGAARSSQHEHRALAGYFAQPSKKTARPISGRASTDLMSGNS
jgi:hypothetical protein